MRMAAKKKSHLSVLTFCKNQIAGSIPATPKKMSDYLIPTSFARIVMRSFPMTLATLIMCNLNLAFIWLCLFMEPSPNWIYWFFFFGLQSPWIYTFFEIVHLDLKEEQWKKQMREMRDS